MTANPYQAPNADVTASSPPGFVGTGVAARPLHNLGNVLLATFLGSPIAGFALVAANFGALGQPSNAARRGSGAY